MQTGLVMIELGIVRFKNSQNIILKNILEISVTAVVFFSIGYPLSIIEDDHSSNI